MHATAAWIAGAALFSALPAAADIITTDLYQPGDGLAYWDTGTNLDWARGPTGPFGGYEGFRLASSTEVATFFTDAGLTSFSGSAPLAPVGTPAPPPFPFPAAVSLVFWGWQPGRVGTQGPYSFQSFIVADPTGSPGVYSFGGMSLGISGQSAVWSMSPLSGQGPTPGPTPIEFAGRALVREHAAVAAIPEPSTYALMLMGLLGVIAWRRRSARRPEHEEFRVRDAIAACIAGAALFSALPAAADIITTDLYQPGDGKLLWDTATNLEWVRGPTGAFGGYEGFRLASSSEVVTLFTGAGLTSFAGSNAAGIPSAFYPTLWFLWHPGGIDNIGPYQTQFFIVADHPSARPDWYTFGSMALGSPLDGAGAWSVSSFTMWGPTPDIVVPIELVGRALVREHAAVAAIPEPSTYALMLMGLLGIGAWRRRRQAAD